jgi:hypothetical protein
VVPVAVLSQIADRAHRGVGDEGASPRSSSTAATAVAYDFDG